MSANEEMVQPPMQLPLVKIKLTRYQKGDFGYEVSASGDVVGDVTDKIAAMTKWLNENYMVPRATI